MKLYFIAILPDLQLRARIEAFKKEIREGYGAKRALRLPAHITLHIPFKFVEDNESLLINQLEIFAKGQNPFEIGLNGFDSFPPRVIFVKIENAPPIIMLHDKLQETMTDFLTTHKQQKADSFHPHITIASRDLTKEAFKKTWAEFKERPFKASFHAESLVLFKHNGKTWDQHKEFLFG